jgi:hypothetical protein
MPTSMAPSPFKTKEEAEAVFEAFIQSLHQQFDDQLNDFADEFVSRMHPELGEFMAKVLETDEAGPDTNALEESPQYDLYYSYLSDTVRAVFLRLMNDFGPNIYGAIQHKESQRERALIGAPPPMVEEHDGQWANYTREQKLVAMGMQWPMTPEEVPPGYGDLVSSIIWYPERYGANGETIVCRNCKGAFIAHNSTTGACESDSAST